MNDLQKAKKQYKELQKQFSNAVDSCSPESNSMLDKVKLGQKKFLKIHSKYIKNEKKFQVQFLKASSEFADILNKQKTMHEKFAKLLNPFTSKIDKISAKIVKLEKMEAKNA